MSRGDALRADCAEIRISTKMTVDAASIEVRTASVVSTERRRSMTDCLAQPLNMCACLQAWCVLELFTGISSGCRLTVGMPPVPPGQSRQRQLDSMLGTGLQTLSHVLSNIKIANAETSVEEDRARILQLINKSVGSAAVDESVTKFLSDWVQQTCEAYLGKLLCAKEPIEATARACVNIGTFLREFNKLERAAEVYECGKQIRLATGTLETPDGADLLMLIGNVKSERGDLCEGLQQYSEAKRVRTITGSLESSEGATLLMNIGSAKGIIGDSDGALEDFLEAKTVYTATGMLGTPPGAGLLMNVELAKLNLGDPSSALEEYMAAKKMHVAEVDSMQSQMSSEDVDMLDDDETAAVPKFGNLVINDQTELSKMKQRKANLDPDQLAPDHLVHILEDDIPQDLADLDASTSCSDIDESDLVDKAVDEQGLKSLEARVKNLSFVTAENARFNKLHTRLMLIVSYFSYIVCRRPSIDSLTPAVDSLTPAV